MADYQEARAAEDAAQREFEATRRRKLIRRLCALAIFIILFVIFNWHMISSHL
ncbi:MAG: hypothetical protein Q3961_02810 [Bifidobacteriaceae bacterium]|nr:hypothetical protein [Bifidobacteriaceae bacterium]